MSLTHDVYMDIVTTAAYRGPFLRATSYYDKSHSHELSLD